jgi:DNA-directed RNA polymerase beta' subunit
MAVHIPLSSHAQAEARVLMLASHNLFSPADGSPIVSPQQDIVLGAFFVTMDKWDSVPYSEAKQAVGKVVVDDIYETYQPDAKGKTKEPKLIVGKDRLLTLDDAKKAAKYGADAVILSNHGGRQLDRAPVPLMLVEQVSKELKKDVEVHIDSGIMSGADIVAAIALGANFTYIGKAYLYGLMAGGQEGVERCLSIIESQIVRTMKLLGVKDLRELTPKQVKILDRLQ